MHAETFHSHAGRVLALVHGDGRGRCASNGMMMRLLRVMCWLLQLGELHVVHAVEFEERGELVRGHDALGLGVLPGLIHAGKTLAETDR